MRCISDLISLCVLAVLSTAGAAPARDGPDIIACGPRVDLQAWTGPALAAGLGPQWQAGVILDYKPGLHCRRVGADAQPPPPAGLRYYAELTAGTNANGVAAGASYEALATRSWRFTTRAGASLTWQGEVGLPVTAELRRRVASRSPLWVSARWASFPVRGNPRAQRVVVALSLARE